MGFFDSIISSATDAIKELGSGLGGIDIFKPPPDDPQRMAEVNRYVMQYQADANKARFLLHETEHKINAMTRSIDGNSIERDINRLESAIRSLRLKLLKVPVRYRSEVELRLNMPSIADATILRKKLGQKLAELNARPPLGLIEKKAYEEVKQTEQQVQKHVYYVPPKTVEQLKEQLEAGNNPFITSDATGEKTFFQLLQKYGVYLIGGVAILIVVVLLLKKK